MQRLTDGWKKSSRRVRVAVVASAAVLGLAAVGALTSETAELDGDEVKSALSEATPTAAAPTPTVDREAGLAELRSNAMAAVVSATTTTQVDFGATGQIEVTGQPSLGDDGTVSFDSVFAHDGLPVAEQAAVEHAYWLAFAKGDTPGDTVQGLRDLALDEGHASDALASGDVRLHSDHIDVTCSVSALDECLIDVEPTSVPTATPRPTPTTPAATATPRPAATATPPPVPTAAPATATPVPTAAPTPAPAAATPVPTAVPAPTPIPAPPTAAPVTRYANCTEARNAGVTPLYRGNPGYGTHLDRDGDGVACE